MTPAAPSLDLLRQALVATARAWRDPKHPARAEAVAQALTAPNRFTEPATAFAVNRAMHQCTERALLRWPGGTVASTPRTVALWLAGRSPLDGFTAVLAVLLRGHRARVACAPADPILLPAFFAAVAARGGAAVAERLPVFVDPEALLDGADALVAQAPGADDEAEAAREALLAQATLNETQVLAYPTQYAVAVLDGRETADELERLTEDLLLHEGLSPDNVAICWAPASEGPDDLLEALALFRSVFEAHPTTPGLLQMPKAFLEAAGQGHAFGEGLEFLLSRGDPAPQTGAHIRWVPYDGLDAVRSWLRSHTAEVRHLVARPGRAAALADAFDHPVLAPGEVHRAPLGGHPGGPDLVGFLDALAGL